MKKIIVTEIYRNAAGLATTFKVMVLGPNDENILTTNLPRRMFVNPDLITKGKEVKLTC